MFRRSSARWSFRRIFRYSLLVATLAAAGFTLYLDMRVRSEFEGRRFALPARIFARPLEVHAGLRISQADIVDELRQLGYREAPPEGESGWFSRNENTLTLALRYVAGAELPLARLEPLMIGGIYPHGNEDRELVRLAEVPKEFVQALLAVEDRSFYKHHGFDPRALARAGRSLFSDRVQGGSTITQQLVKNFFLTPERTVQRKATELVMAVLLEIHYDKDEILETYLNEIYFGQDRDRAIHGVGLAAQFYFGKDVQYLNVAESALLVGMIRGPGHYDPYKHAARTLERRNLVLRETRDQGQLTLEQYASARAAPLGVSRKTGMGTSPY